MPSVNVCLFANYHLSLQFCSLQLLHNRLNAIIIIPVTTAVVPGFAQMTFA